jgi:hypothetical protein
LCPLQKENTIRNIVQIIRENRKGTITTTVVITIMTNRTQKGFVKFRQPPVKLVADMPEDEEVREHLDEMKANDGYQGSCGIISSQKKE